jgi:hypothetical protein
MSYRDPGFRRGDEFSRILKLDKGLECRQEPLATLKAH